MAAVPVNQPVGQPEAIYKVPVKYTEKLLPAVIAFALSWILVR